MMTSRILGEYQNGRLQYAGTVTMGVRGEIAHILQKDECPFSDIPTGKEYVNWCKPEYICIPGSIPVLILTGKGKNMAGPYYEKYSCALRRPYF